MRSQDTWESGFKQREALPEVEGASTGFTSGRSQGLAGCLVRSCSQAHDSRTGTTGRDRSPTWTTSPASVSGPHCATHAPYIISVQPDAV